MKAGQLEIEGTIDTQEIIAGLDRIANSLENTQAKGNNVNSTMGFLTKTTSSLAKNFFLISTVGVGAITALASKSPAVAPALAKASVEIMKLQNALGEHLVPIFEAIADDLLPGIGTAIENNSGLMGKFINLTAQGITDIGKLTSGQSEDIDKLEEKAILTGAGAAAGGAIAGKSGAGIGALLGYALTDVIVPDAPDYYKRNLGPFAETFAATKEAQDLQLDNPEGTFKASVQNAGKIVGTGARISTNLIIDTIQYLFLNSNNKQLDMASVEVQEP